MQLDEYDRKVAERDALSSVFKDPSKMKAIIDQGVYRSPDALRLSNEVANIGTKIQSVADRSVLRDAQNFDSSNTFDETDTLQSRAGDTRNYLERMAAKSSNKDDAYRAKGALEAADIFGRELAGSGSAESATRLKDEVIGGMSKGQVRDMYMQGLLSQ